MRCSYIVQPWFLCRFTGVGATACINWQSTDHHCEIITFETSMRPRKSQVHTIFHVMSQLTACLKIQNFTLLLVDLEWSGRTSYNQSKTLISA